MSLINLNQINIADNTLTQAVDGSIPVSLKFGGSKWSSNYTGAILVPKGTTAQRITSPTVGHFRYNTDTNEMEAYNIAGWGSLTKFAQNGTAGDPSRSFSNDPDTGMYLESVGTLAFSANSVKRLAINQTKVIVNDTLELDTVQTSLDGTLRLYAPNNKKSSIVFGDTDNTSRSYIRYNHATDKMEFSGTGVNPAFNIDGSSNAVTFDGAVIFNGSVSLPPISLSSTGDLIGIIDSDNNDSSSVFKIQQGAAIDTGFTVTQTGTVTTANGTITIPSYSFINSTNTGIRWDSGTSEITVGVSGADVMRIGSSQARTYNPIRYAAGSTTAPSMAFTGDTSTGIYSAGAGIISFSAVNSERMRIGTTQTLSNNDLIVDGTVYFGSSSTGMEVLKANTTTILGSQTNTVIASLTYVALTYEYYVVEYIINRSGLGMKSGRLQIATDGTNIDFSDTEIELLTPGVEFSVVLNATNINIRYTSTAGVSGTMKYVVRRMGL